MGEKSKAFAIRIVRACQYLQREKKEFTLSNQLLRSGTSIGANLAEADYAFSHKDFLSKLYIALKEAAETVFWLELLLETDYFTKEQCESLCNDAEELLKMLTAATKTAKAKN